MKTIRSAALAATGLVLASPSVLFAQTAPAATGPDYSGLTSGIDFTSTNEMLLSVGALLVGVALVVMGIKKVLRFIR